MKHKIKNIILLLIFSNFIYIAQSNEPIIKYLADIEENKKTYIASNDSTKVTIQAFCNRERDDYKLIEVKVQDQKKDLFTYMTPSSFEKDKTLVEFFIKNPEAEKNIRSKICFPDDNKSELDLAIVISTTGILHKDENEDDYYELHLEVGLFKSGREAFTSLYVGREGYKFYFNKMISERTQEEKNIEIERVENKSQIESKETPEERQNSLQKTSNNQKAKENGQRKRIKNMSEEERKEHDAKRRAKNKEYQANKRKHLTEEEIIRRSEYMKEYRKKKKKNLTKEELIIRSAKLQKYRKERRKNMNKEQQEKNKVKMKEYQAERRKNLPPEKRKEENRKDRERKQKAKEKKQKRKIDMTEEDLNKQSKVIITDTVSTEINNQHSSKTPIENNNSSNLDKFSETTNQNKLMTDIAKKIDNGEIPLKEDFDNINIVIHNLELTIDDMSVNIPTP